MKKWIMFILKSNCNLDTLVEKIDDKIDKASLDLITPVHKIYQKIFALNDLKIKLINLRVLHNSLLSILDDSEKALIKANRINMSIIKKCVRQLLSLGYNEDVFLSEYLSSKDLRLITFGLV